MYHGKHVSRRRHRRNNKTVILLASLVLILGVAIGTTAAFLVDDTQGITNTFTPASVSVEVKEDFQDNIKQNVYLHNTSNVKVYVRATVVEYWTNSAGEIVYQPDGCQASIEWNLIDWTKEGGVYYYDKPLEPNGSAQDDTTNLIDKVTVTNLASGYEYHLDVYAEAIQADGLNATNAQNAWENAKTAISQGG